MDYSFDYASRCTVLRPHVAWVDVLDVLSEVSSVQGHLGRDASVGVLSHQRDNDDHFVANSCTVTIQLFRSEQRQLPDVIPCQAYYPPATHLRVSELPNHRTHNVRA